MRRFPRSVLLLLSILCGRAAAGDGDLDTTFSGDGTLILPTNRQVEAVALAPAPDGGVFVGATLRFEDSNEKMIVYRVRSNGTLFQAFGMAGGTGIEIDEVADGADRLLALFADPDGSLLIVGTVEVAQTEHDALMLLRLDATGDRDATFGDEGLVLLRDNPWEAPSARFEIEGATRLPDGAILVAGTVDGNNTVTRRMVLRRILADGTPDATFGDAGWVSLITGDNHDVTAPHVDTQGRIVVGASIKGSLSGGRGASVYRFTAQGSPDPSFGDGGRITLPDDGDEAGIDALALDATDRVLVSLWNLDVVDIHVHSTLHRVSTAGTLDAGFGTDGTLRIDLEDGVSIAAMQLRADGRAVLAGRIDHTGGSRDLFGARVRADGTLDPGFDGNGVARFEVDPVNPDTATALLLSAGKPMLAGRLDDDEDSIVVVRLASDWMFGDGLEGAGSAP